MKHRSLLWALAIMLAMALVGCKKAEPTPVADAGIEEWPAGAPRGLGGVNGLALGTLELEGSEEAVTPAQAAELLPLWQMVQGGSLQGDAETQAVLKRIEGTMTESQLAAIEAMELTWEDMQAWRQEQGLEMPARPGGQQGGPGTFQDLSEEERARMREEFQNMSPEQRATRMAESGFQRPEGAPEGRGQGGGPGGRQFNLLLDPLVELLNARAGE